MSEHVTPSWPGAGPHEGHTISHVESWPPRLDGGVITCGRVLCSCGKTWAVSGWPAAIADHLFALAAPTPGADT